MSTEAAIPCEQPADLGHSPRENRPISTVRYNTPCFQFVLTVFGHGEPDGDAGWEGQHPDARHQQIGAMKIRLENSA